MLSCKAVLVKEGGSKKVNIKTTMIVFVINYLFFYIPVSLYLTCYYGYSFFNLYMLFLSLVVTSLSLWLNVRFYFFTDLIAKVLK
ncbi:TetR family transcriptional regulator [Salmonella enterica]|nr:TetR family transcriptional regulator [Salmonella enterica]EEH5466747.1 TetR family transcriptional regulator [Salmonella enterica]EEH7556230.1 TetR family transcriptional regulator [Salmonella enterica]